MNSDRHKIECRPILRKMFNATAQTLTIRNIRKCDCLEGMVPILDSGCCKILIIMQSHFPDVVLDILSRVAKSNNTLAEIHIDVWNVDYERFMCLLRECVDAHRDSLEYLTLKCRFPMDYLAMIFDFIPNTLKILDLSENTIKDSSFFGTLIKYIGSSELETIRLVNCKIGSDDVKEFVKLLLNLETPVSLKKIDGVDLANCDEIPVSVRKTMKESLKIVRKRQMCYKDYSRTSGNEGSCHFIDYLRNVIFMKRLVGTEVRVWWPATIEENRTAFAGRFWPAKILMVNPIDLVFVVKYDNEDIDHVPCKYVQPLNPFKYGGGLNCNFINQLIGSDSNAGRCQNSIKEGLYAHGQPCADLGVYNKQEAGYNNSLDRYNSGLIKTPDRTDSINTSYSDMTKNSSASNTTKYEDGFVCKNCGFLNNFDEPSNTGFTLDSVETTLGLDEKFGQNLLVPGEFCEFRDPLDQFRNDPSDYIGVVVKVNRSEPLYECACVYQDNSEVISVHSKDIRRALVIPWYNWVETAFRIILDLKSNFNDYGLNSPNSTPVRYLNGSLNTHSATVHNTTLTCKTPVNSASKEGLATPNAALATPNYSAEAGYANLTQTVCSSASSATAYDYENTPKNEFERGTVKSDISETKSSSSSNDKLYENCTDENFLNNNFYYLPTVESLDLADYCPPNPLEMKLLTLYKYSELVSSTIKNHPKLQVDNSNNEIDVVNLKLKSLMEFNEILQKELQNERNKNIELQSKFKCILCFDKEINCVIYPCAHFSFCYKCVDGLKTCPVCRHRISTLKILNLN